MIILNKIIQNKYWFLLILSVFHLFFSVDYYRLHMPDDNAIAYLNFKQFHNYLFTTDLMGYQSHWNHYSFIMSYFSGGLQTILPNIYSLTKYLALVITLFSLTMFYLYMKMITNKLIALKSLILFTLLPLTVVASHSPRPEMIIIGLIFFSLYTIHKYQTNKAYFWVALFSAIAMDIHPNILYVPILTIGLNFVMNREKIMPILKYGSLGYLIGGILVVLSRIPIFDILLDTESISHSIGSYDIFQFLLGMIFADRGVGVITFLIFITPIVFLFIKYQNINEITGAKSLFILLFISFSIYLLIGRLSGVYFLIPLVFFIGLFVLITQNKLKWLYSGITFILILYWIVVFLRYGGANYQAYGEKIVKVAQPCMSEETIVVASEYEWPFFKNYQFIAYEDNSYKEKNGRGTMIENIIKKQPNKKILFIVDELMNDWIDKGVDWGSPLTKEIKGRPSKSTLKYFRKIGEVKNNFYGSHSNKKGVNTIQLFCTK